MAKADDEQGRGVGQDATYGVVELKPFAGDPFDGKTKRRWAAVRFASEGASVVAVDLPDQDLAATTRLVEDAGGRCLAAPERGTVASHLPPRSSAVLAACRGETPLHGRFF